MAGVALLFAAKAGANPASQAQQLFSACIAHDVAGWDYSALVRTLEMLGNHAIAAGS